MNTLKEKTSQKKAGWEEKLNIIIQDNIKIPFIWGTNDCATLMADCVMAMTGIDPLDWARGKYVNKFQALKVLKDHFGIGYFETFSRIFDEAGFQVTDEFDLGDIGFVRIENLDTEASEMFDGITLVTGVGYNGAVVAPGKNRLVLIRQYIYVKSWKL